MASFVSKIASSKWVGLVLLILGLGWIYWTTTPIALGSPIIPPKSNESLSVTKLHKIIPYDIFRGLEQATSLQRDERVKQYIGRKVKWKGSLVDISRVGNKVRVFVNGGRWFLVRIIGIVFEVDPNKYPGIGLLKKGDLVEVEGIIENINTLVIIVELKDAKIISY